jgi:serine/threonine-protein kinase
MSKFNPDRRKVLAATGVALSVGLAGCGGGGDDNGNGGDGGDGGSGAESPDAYLSDNDANNYDGNVADETGSDSVTVMVGAGENGLAFDPAAVQVDSGTEITWEWTGNGGQHNVIGDAEPTATLDSGEAVSEEGNTYSETLDTAGTYGYFCDPHRSSGMYGAVEVVEGGGNGGDGGNSSNSSE